MRPSTIALQLVCVALGVVFFWSAFALSRAPFGGLLIGSFLFMAAASLGADHTSSPGSSTRRRLFFKVLSILATAPVVAIGLYGAEQAVVRGEWATAVGFLLKVTALLAILAAIALDSHPIVRGLLRRRGISAPGTPSDGPKAP